MSFCVLVFPTVAGSLEWLLVSLSLLSCILFVTAVKRLITRCIHATNSFFIDGSPNEVQHYTALHEISVYRNHRWGLSKI